MKKVVIKLGGSLFSTSDETLIDYNYLNSLKSVLDPHIAKGTKFAIVVGGGYLCRKYQNMAKTQGEISNRNLDWIGIASINLNAEMIRTLWADEAHEEIIRYNDYDDMDEMEFDKPIRVCAAGGPGHSSDVDAVEVANHLQATHLYRFTDVDAIYTKDPAKFDDAQMLSDITWQEYYDILGISEFVPGGHYPIDPVAAKMAEESGLTFLVMSGKDLAALEDSLNGDSFHGTTVSSSSKF